MEVYIINSSNVSTAVSMLKKGGKHCFNSLRGGIANVAKNCIQYNFCSVVCIIFLLFPCLCMAQQKTAPDWMRRDPEITYGGLRMFLYSNDRVIPIDKYPTLYSLLDYGFVLNPEHKETCIGPDGKVVPMFHDAYWVVNPDQRNNDLVAPTGTPHTYSGEIFIPDSIENKYKEGCYYYILGFNTSSIGDQVQALRTPCYNMLEPKGLMDAVNMQKVQIGTCYAIHPCAMLNCNKLETIIIEKSPYIYEYAFAYCPAIKEVVLQSETELPLIVAANAFEDLVYENATLYLPERLMQQCEQDPVWSKFIKRKSLKEYKEEFMKFKPTRK